jgi:hypothetical protein
MQIVVVTLAVCGVVLMALCWQFNCRCIFSKGNTDQNNNESADNVTTDSRADISIDDDDEPLLPSRFRRSNFQRWFLGKFKKLYKKAYFHIFFSQTVQKRMPKPIPKSLPFRSF